MCLYADGTLTPAGKAAGTGLLLVLVVLNWFGVKLFARLNLVVTAIKVLIPVLTVVALLLSSLHPENVSAGGGFAPYGWSAVLTAIAGAGIIYGLDGFAAPIELAGETRNARKGIPRAALTAICASMLLYLVLQVTFVLTIPTESLGGGWQALSFTSPFGELALLLNLSWLAMVIYADAVFSPAGSTYVIVAAGSRETYAVARNKALPRRFARVSERAGVPRNAMALNFALSMVFLLSSSGWQQIIGVFGVLAVLTYSLCTVAAGTFLAAAPHRLAGWVPGLRWLAPAGFVVGSELIYWGSWPNLRISLSLLAASCSCSSCCVAAISTCRPSCAPAPGSSGTSRGCWHCPQSAASVAQT